MVASEADALSALFEGETSRAIAQHQMNKESSRSHACFTIYVESRPSPDSDEVGSFDDALAAATVAMPSFSSLRMEGKGWGVLRYP